MYQQSNTLKAFEQDFGIRTCLSHGQCIYSGSSLSIKRKLPLREGSRSLRHNLSEACKRERGSHRKIDSVYSE